MCDVYFGWKVVEVFFVNGVMVDINVVVLVVFGEGVSVLLIWVGELGVVFDWFMVLLFGVYLNLVLVIFDVGVDYCLVCDVMLVLVV